MAAVMDERPTFVNVKLRKLDELDHDAGMDDTSQSDARV